FDDFAIHAISGPGNCSTKLVVTNNQANQGPFDPSCDVPETVVPEPASVVLMATGLLALVGGGAVRNRRKRHEV
ncbi:MAG TPA: PEP-CTERM sorting domain-containing protein, partial [Gemmatimonadaceae bacterium]|nr:PEP-CTERM sorting domain-containing protein [Gemmatimonadaceae bacterium]